MRSFLIAFVLALFTGCNGQVPWTRTTMSYAAVDSSTQLMDVYRPSGVSGTLPTVVFIHGGKFEMGSRKDGEKYADHLCSAGLEVISIDYRLSTTVKWPAQLDDARAALRYVRANVDKVGAGKIGVMGASAGACLAELVAREYDPQDAARPECLVSISGYGDATSAPAFFDEAAVLTTLFGHEAPFPAEELAAISPAVGMTSCAPALIAHSIGDSDVFIATGGDAFDHALTLLGVEHTYLRRMGWAHGDQAWEQDGGIRSETAAFLLRHLK